VNFTLHCAETEKLHEQRSVSCEESSYAAIIIQVWPIAIKHYPHNWNKSDYSCQSQCAMRPNDSASHQLRSVRMPTSVFVISFS